MPAAPVAGTPGQNQVLVTPAGRHRRHPRLDGAGERRRQASPGSSRAATPTPTAAATVTASIGMRRTITARPPARRPAGRLRPFGGVPSSRFEQVVDPSGEARCARRAGWRPARRRGRSASRRRIRRVRRRAGIDRRLAATRATSHSTPARRARWCATTGWAKRSSPGPAVPTSYAVAAPNARARHAGRHRRSAPSPPSAAWPSRRRRRRRRRRLAGLRRRPRTPASPSTVSTATSTSTDVAVDASASGPESCGRDGHARSCCRTGCSSAACATGSGRAGRRGPRPARPARAAASDAVDAAPSTPARRRSGCRTGPAAGRRGGCRPRRSARTTSRRAPSAAPSATGQRSRESVRAVVDERHRDAIAEILATGTG